MRVVVYTAVFGGYDLLKEPIPQNIDCDFVCFTDTKMPKRVGSWHIVHVPAEPNIHPRMQAKRFKLMSQEVFPGGRLPLRTALRAGLLRLQAYDASLWIDGSIAIKGSHFVRAAIEGLSSDEIAFFVHPDRDCIYDEADLSVTMPKYQGQNIGGQVAHYRSLGTRPHAGLYACGIIGRLEPSKARVRSFNEIWWGENLRWTYQDQLSVNYALTQSNARVRPIKGNLWKNDYFDWIAHTTNL